MRKYVFLAIFILLFLWQSFTLGLSTDKLKIAILYFKDTSINRSFSSFVEGLPDMLMTNLGKSDEIIIVERVQIDEAIRNFELERLKYIDESTAVKIGKWIGANAVILGNFSSIGENVRIDARVINIESGTLMKSAKVQGKSDELFDLVDTLAEDILNVLTGELKSFKEEKKVLLDKEFNIKIPNYHPTVPVHWKLLDRSIKNSELAVYSDIDNPENWFKLTYSADIHGSGGGNAYRGYSYHITCNTFYVNLFCQEHKSEPIELMWLNYNGRTGYPNQTCGNLKVDIELIDYEITPIRFRPGSYSIPDRQIEKVRFRVIITRIDI